MAKYRVLSSLHHGGKRYPIGSIAELEDGTFQPSLIGQVLELIPEPLPIETNEEVSNRSKKKVAAQEAPTQETTSEVAPTETTATP